MRLTVVGAGPAYTDRPGASGASYLLRQRGSSLLLDLGQGSFPRLAGLIEPAELDGILVSHLHPDHFVDLVALRHYLRYERPPVRMRVVGPAGLADRIDALHGEPGFSAASLDVEALGDGPFRIGGFDVRPGRVTHTSSSYGFRVSAAAEPSGPGLVYSGDCGLATDLDSLVRPGDVLLCEVSFGPGPVPAGAQHLDAPAVGDLARRTGAGAVLLTHLQMGFDREATVAGVRARYEGGPVDLVDPGFETLVGD
jgi:ribonuclease BN (tRNA processing enzyme)